MSTINKRVRARILSDLRRAAGRIDYRLEVTGHNPTDGTSWPRFTVAFNGPSGWRHVIRHARAREAGLAIATFDASTADELEPFELTPAPLEAS